MLVPSSVSVVPMDADDSDAADEGADIDAELELSTGLAEFNTDEARNFQPPRIECPPDALSPQSDWAPGTQAYLPVQIVGCLTLLNERNERVPGGTVEVVATGLQGSSGSRPLMVAASALMTREQAGVPRSLDQGPWTQPPQTLSPGSFCDSLASASSGISPPVTDCLLYTSPSPRD